MASGDRSCGAELPLPLFQDGVEHPALPTILSPTPETLGEKAHLLTILFGTQGAVGLRGSTALPPLKAPILTLSDGWRGRWKRE